jgi:hypothetical protein
MTLTSAVWQPRDSASKCARKVECSVLAAASKARRSPGAACPFTFVRRLWSVRSGSIVDTAWSAGMPRDGSIASMIFRLPQSFSNPEPSRLARVRNSFATNPSTMSWSSASNSSPHSFAEFVAG